MPIIYCGMEDTLKIKTLNILINNIVFLVP
jgi:hypothetical protein